MTVTHNEDVIINDNLEVNGSSDEVQVIVKGASTQTSALQQWKDNSGTVLSEIDEDGHLLVGDQDGTIDALIESHSIEDSSKPSRGLHSKGVLTGTLSSLVSWAVKELGLKGTGGISALHRALRVQATNENTGDMDVGADIRAGDFEVINTGGNASVNNLELSALVAKVSNQSGAYTDKAYGLKVEIDDAGSSNDVYAIYTDNGIVHLGDLLELVAGVVLEDSATDGVLGITPRSVAPTSPTSGMMYLDDGTNRTDGLVGFRRWNGSSWDDIMDTSSIGDGNVSGPGSSTDNAIARFDSTTGKLLQNSSATLDDNGKITTNVLKINDSSTTPPLNITERSTAPTTPSSGDIYLDDGTNTASGEPGWRRYTGSAWEDVGGSVNGTTFPYTLMSHTVSDSEIELRSSGSVKDKVAQSFQISSDDDVATVKLYLKKTGTPTGTLTLRIETDSSGSPSGTLIDANATATLMESSLTTSLDYYDFTFTAFNLVSNTNYWLVLSTDRTADASNYVAWGYDSNELYSEGILKSEVSSVWGSETGDARFIIMSEGSKQNYVMIEPTHSTITFNSTTWIDISSTYYSVDLAITSGVVDIYFVGRFASDGDSGKMFMNVAIDDVDQDTDHLWSLSSDDGSGLVVNYHKRVTGLSAGVHRFRIRHKRSTNDTFRIYGSGAHLLIEEVH